MSLYKQIAGMMTLFIVIVMGSVLWVNFSSSKEFIQKQLFNNSIDTANSLGLTIQNSGTIEDTATIDAMISAVFDNGFYDKILLVDTDNNPIVSKSLDEAKTKAPRWFVELVDISFLPAKAEIMNGWSMYGKLYVRSDKTHAYDKMWESFLSLLKLFSLITAVLLVTLYLFLRFLLRPLAQLNKQARAVDNNEFMIVESTPSTTEFKNVVNSMNKVVRKLETIFNKEAQTLRKYHELLYKDPDTKLGNRNYFNMQLKSFIRSRGELSIGTVWMMEFDHYDLLKKNVGFQKVSTLVESLVETVEQIFKDYDDRLLCRINSGTFMLILPGSDLEALEDSAEKLYTDFQKKALEIGVGKENGMHFAVALTPYSHNSTIRDILTKSDFALAHAHNQTQIKIYANQEESRRKPLTKEEWVQTLENTFEHDTLQLQPNPVTELDGSVHMQEFTPVVIGLEGEEHIPGEYRPVIKSLGWIKRFQQYLIRKLLDRSDAGSSIVALNAELLEDRGFIKWIKETLPRHPDKRLYFEFSAQAASLNAVHIKDFNNLLLDTVHGIGLDGFSLESSDLEYLKQIQPSYIKIERDYLLGEQEGSELTVNTLRNITSSIGTRIIVKNICDGGDLERLKEFGITLYQSGTNEQCRI